MPDATNGLSNILGGFAAFRDGVTAHKKSTAAAATITFQKLAFADGEIALPLVNGAPLGEWAGDGWLVPLRQVDLAPAEDLLNSHYDPATDPDFPSLVEAVKALGNGYRPLPVLPADRNLDDGTPLFHIYARPHVYHALVKLYRSHIKVELKTVQHPGEILLQSIGEQGGQLERAPSIIELCEAVVRLSGAYQLSDDEIAAMLSVNREDNAPPSVQQVHYLRIVGKLPTDVKEMVERKDIHWSHAKDIAEYAGKDDGLARLLARLATQGGTMTVDQLRMTIKRLRHGTSTLHEAADGFVREVRRDQKIMLAAERHPTDIVVPYAQVMAVKPSQIRARLAAYHPHIEPAAVPGESRVAAQSWQPLVDYLATQNKGLALQALEAEIQAFMIRVREAAREAGIITEAGVLITQIDAAKAARGAS